VNPSDLIPLLLPEAVLLAAAFALLSFVAVPKLRRAHPAIPRWVALAGLIGAAALMITKPFSAGVDSQSNPLLRPDGLADVGRLWIFLLALPAVLTPPGRNEKRPHEFLAVVLFSVLGLSLAVIAEHLLLLFVALELAALSFYLLAAWTRSRETAAAGIRFFLFGAVASAFFLYGCSLIYGAVPQLTFPAMFGAFAGGTVPDFAMLGLLMVVLALVFKLAAAPLHGWAPEVYEKAPVRVVFLIAGASKVTAALVLAKLCLFAFPGAAGSAVWGQMKAGWTLWFGVLAVASMIWGNLLALGQSSVRRLLAASAIANAGYALVGFASGGAGGISMAVYHMIVYALATTGVLVVTNRVLASRGGDSLDHFRGLARRSPWQAVVLVICLGSLAGLPPLAGFFAKFQLFAAVLAEAGSGVLWLVLPAVALSAVSLYYYLRVLRRIFERGEGENADETSHEGLPHAALWPMTAVFGLGLLPSVLLGPLFQAVADALSATGLP
jgi:NADH-quinone oxidoreductase subunit N